MTLNIYQYKKDNEKALNISGNEIQSMIAYRQELDAARERELSRGTNHKKDSAPDKSRGKKHKKHKHKKKPFKHSMMKKILCYMGMQVQAKLLSCCILP